MLDLDVVQVGVDGDRHVRCEGPGGRCPDKEGALPAPQRELHVDTRVGELPVPLCDDLVLADAGAAPGAPGHRVEALVDPPLIVELLEDGPDHVVVLVGEGVVAASHLA